MEAITVTLGGTEYVVERATLYLWFKLEGILDTIKTAVGSGDEHCVSSNIFSYLATALGIDNTFSDLPWTEVATAFSAIQKLNTPTYKFPLLNATAEDKLPDWDYTGRDWYVWVYLLAREFGWNIEYISMLNVDDAIALVQEILVKEQLDKEWQWGLSEMSHVYDSSSRTSKFKPLPRPNWMENKHIEMPKVVKINKALIPVGRVVRFKDGRLDA